MLFERETWRGKSGPFTAGKVVCEVVCDAPGYGSGELEALQAQVRKLTDICEALADALPLDKQRRFVDTISYGFTPVKG